MDFFPGIDGPSDCVPRVLACFSNNLLRHEPLKLVDGDQSKRTFVYIKNATKENPARANDHIFSVGNPKNEVTIRWLAEIMTQIEKIDIVTDAMGLALAAKGGFCIGSSRLIDHQRLSSSGYVFSASLPPYVASAAISAIDVVEEKPNLITKLKENVASVWSGLSSLQGLKIVSNPHTPIVFLKLKNSTGSLKSDLQLLEDMADQLLREHNVFVVVSKRSTLDKCPLPVGIRLFISVGHSKSDLETVCASLKSVVTFESGDLSCSTIVV